MHASIHIRRDSSSGCNTAINIRPLWSRTGHDFTVAPRRWPIYPEVEGWSVPSRHPAISERHSGRGDYQAKAADAAVSDQIAPTAGPYDPVHDLTLGPIISASGNLGIGLTSTTCQHADHCHVYDLITAHGVSYYRPLFAGLSTVCFTFFLFLSPGYLRPCCTAIRAGASEWSEPGPLAGDCSRNRSLIRPLSDVADDNSLVLGTSSESRLKATPRCSRDSAALELTDHAERALQPNCPRDRAVDRQVRPPRCHRLLHDS